MAPKGNMSHAEIWDDSALVNSWNDALEEYKKYHSIAARGEDVDDVLAKAESKNHGEEDGEMNSAEGEADHPIAASTTLPRTTLSEENVINGGQKEHRDEFQARETASSSNNPTQEPDRHQPALPQHLIGQVHDEGHKNLLMSWYYAGYYTGLYEGQQQGKASKPNGNQEG